MHIRMTAGAFVVSMASALLGAEPATKIRFDVPAGWKTERIALPPSFAPQMNLKGTEEVRFAPGMFQPTSDSFFSYMFVFQVQSDPELTRDVIDRELLRYYRGLASAVSKGRNATVDTTQFTIELKQKRRTDAKAADSSRRRRYEGDLKWVEPFVTQRRQTLHLEVDVWTNSKTRHNYLFICVSPQDKQAAIWKTMRELRRSFLDANGQEPSWPGDTNRQGRSRPAQGAAHTLPPQPV